MSAGAVSGVLNSLLDKARASWPVVGAAACLVGRDGERRVALSGYADAASGRPVTGRTTFQIGSISKSFTGLVLMQLAEQGKVDLAAPVTDYLPWFAVRSRFEPIALRHLLHHTSGLIAGSDALPDALAQAYSLRATETGSAPGSFFHYSNVGYALLGLVIERVTGRTLEDVTTETLLGPLGMADSSARITDAQHASLATGYQSLHTDRPLLPGDPLIPATWFQAAAGDGHVVATATDLGRYARMLIGRGELDGVRVVGADTFAQIINDLAVGGEPSDYPSHYGLGINVEQIDGHTCLTHGGGMVGYSAFLAVDLDAEQGVVVLTNAPGEFPIAELIARRALEAVRTGSEPSPSPARTNVVDADRYRGTFADDAHRIVVSRQADGQLRLDSDQGSGVLYETGQGRLACDHPRWRRFTHRLVGEGALRRWTWGPSILELEGTDGSADGLRPFPSGLASPLVGRYRSYSPWYPDLRIVQRGPDLVLCASAGVEAHTDDPELVELDDGSYRIGADPRLPERMICGPVVDGEAIWVDRDGCRYSRCFLD